MFMPYVVGALVGIVIGAAFSWKQISDLQATIRFMKNRIRELEAAHTRYGF